MSISRTPCIAVLLVWAITLLTAGCEKRPERVYRLGYLGPQSEAVAPWIAKAIRDQLRDDGFVEGKNLVIDWRWAEGKPERLHAMAAELVALKPDALFVSGEEAYGIAKRVSGAVPIVAFLCSNPERQGLVASMAHPGGNLTGASLDCVGSSLRARQLQLLKQIVPKAKKLAVLWYSGTADKDPLLAELEAGAHELEMQLVSVPVRNGSDFDAAFAAATAGHADVLLLLPDSILSFHRARLAELALRHRLPSVWVNDWAQLGGLVSYGGNLLRGNRQAASKLAPIFRGAKPSDLPFENPTQFDFVINLKTAKALGLTVPNSVLIQATEVIE